MIVVHTLGPLDIRHGERGSLATVLAQPRRAALLAFLVIEGGTHFVRRDALLALFWPDSDEARARAALRQALAFLRRALGEAAIRTRGDEEVGVDPEQVSSDLSMFRQALAAGRDAEALALYRGELLGGLVVDGAPDFERWCANQRLVAAREAAACASRLARQAANGADWSAAVSLSERALALDPFDESHVRQLLTALDARGDRAGALQAYETFQARLADTLDATPSPETVAVVEGIRMRRARHGDASRGEGGRPAEAAAPFEPAPDASGAGAPALPGAPGASPAPRAAAPASPPITIPTGRWIAAAGAVVILAVAAWLLVGRPRSAGPAPGANRAGIAGSPAGARRIVVVPLDVAGSGTTTDSGAGSPTGADQSLGAIAADWITEGISRMEGVEVVPAMAVLATQRSLPAGDREVRRTAATSWQALARDLGASVVVRGTIYRQGDAIHLQAQVVDAADGRVLRPVQRVSVSADSVIAGIDRLRVHVLAALAPVADTVTHLRLAVAPPSYEAYQSYVRGLEAFVTGDLDGALARFRAASAADSNYPMPRIAATIALFNQGDAVGAHRLLTPLLAERDRLGPLEQATLDMVRGFLTGDLDITYDAVVRQARIAPGTIGEYMVAETARRMGRPAEALAVLRRLGPDRGELRGWRAYWRELTYSLHLLGRHEEELVAARDARTRYPSDGAVLGYELRALAALGRRGEVAATLAGAEGTSASPVTRAVLRLTAVTEWRTHGHPGADVLLAAVSAWFDSIPANARATPAMRRQEARVRLLQGRASEARALLAPLLRPVADTAAPTMPTLGLAGAAAAAAGDSASARALMSEIAVRAAAMPAAARGASWGDASYWRAVIAAQLADSLGALSLLRDARREGLGIDPTVHAEPAFAVLRHWPPFAAGLQRAER